MKLIIQIEAEVPDENLPEIMGFIEKQTRVTIEPANWADAIEGRLIGAKEINGA